MEKVRCADCGFLCVRDLRNGNRIEVDADGRQEWRFAQNLSPGTNTVPEVDGVPFCFVGAIPIHKEPEDGLARIQKNRPCGKFTAWLAGLSPKEHQDMIVGEHLLKIQEDFRERDRAWQAEQKERDRQFQQDQNSINRRTQWMLAVVVAIVGIGGIWFGAHLKSTIEDNRPAHQKGDATPLPAPLIPQ